MKFYPEYNLEDVILNRKILKDVLIRDYNGIDIIPASSGVERMADLEPDQRKRLIRKFSELSGYDYFFFDTSAGISRNVVSFCMASSEVIMVITSESTSLIDAYALLTVLSMSRIETDDLKTFWKKSLEFFQIPLKLPGRQREEKRLEKFKLKESKKIYPRPEQLVNDKVAPSDLENKKPLTAPTDSPEQIGTGDQVQDIHVAINHLEHRISSISRDLVEIKKILEKGIKILPENSDVALENENMESKPAVLHFDFETFLNHRKLKG